MKQNIKVQNSDGSWTTVANLLGEERKYIGKQKREAYMRGFREGQIASSEPSKKNKLKFKCGCKHVEADYWCICWFEGYNMGEAENNKGDIYANPEESRQTSEKEECPCHCHMVSRPPDPGHTYCMQKSCVRSCVHCAQTEKEEIISKI